MAAAVARQCMAAAAATTTAAAAVVAAAVAVVVAAVAAAVAAVVTAAVTAETVLVMMVLVPTCVSSRIRPIVVSVWRAEVRGWAFKAPIAHHSSTGDIVDHLDRRKQLPAEQPRSGYSAGSEEHTHAHRTGLKLQNPTRLSPETWNAIFARKSTM